MTILRAPGSQKRGQSPRKSLRSDGNQGQGDATRRALQELDKNALPTASTQDTSRNKRQALTTIASNRLLSLQETIMSITTLDD